MAHDKRGSVLRFLEDRYVQTDRNKALSSDGGTSAHSNAFSQGAGLTDAEERLIALLRSHTDLEDFSITIRRADNRVVVSILNTDVENVPRLGAGDTFDKAWFAAGGLPPRPRN